ncbi:hypothetical protein GQ53DRAFT_808039 [Thozetella sp. PMI_491]|nr:hypothetical protein GQ53DRAFT_808039 [Thozetella sp. PMI_491]
MKRGIPLVALFGAVAAKVGLMVPFYEYPTDPNGAQADWDALIAAIDAHPSLPFTVIIDNNNGAPYTPNPPASLQDWSQRLGQLNAPSRSNVKTVGYIATTGSTRSISDVEAGIDQYLGWTTFKDWSNPPVQQDVHIDGIFFDEINTAPAFLQYNQAISRYAKNAVNAKGRGGTVVLNPGVAVAPGSETLFDEVDAILNLETCYTKVQGATDPNSSIYRCPTGGYTPFTPASLNTLPTSNQTRVSRSSVVVHDFYETWTPYQPASVSVLTTDVNAIIAKNVHSFYIAQYGYRGNFTQGPASITAVANLAAAAQGLSRRQGRLR